MTPLRQNRARLYRRINLAVYVIVFAVAGPWLALTASGYRIDLAGRRLLRTGVLTIGSFPENASVFIDDEPQSGRTPVTIPSLTPRDYTVRLEKSGYQSWSKRLTVHPNGGTIVNDALLFAATPPIEPAAVTAATDFSQSPVKPDRLWLQPAATGAAIFIEHIDRQRVDSLGIIAPPAGPFVWSPSGDRVAVVTEAGLSVIDLVTATVDSLAGDISVAAWETSSALLAIQSGQLVRLTLDPLRLAEPGSSGWIDIGQTGNDLVGLTNGSGGLRFGPINRKTLELAEPTVRLNVSSQARLLLTRPDWPVVSDPSNRQTVILERHGDQFTAEPIGPVGPAVAWNSRRQLLLSDGFELQYWDEGTRTTTLLNRFGQPVIQAAWLGDLPGVVFRQAASLSAIEMDDRGGRQITPLLDGDLGPMAVINNGRDLLIIRDGQPAMVRLQP